MKYTKLGNSNLNVSRICLGCMGFGEASKGQHAWTLDYDASKQIIKYALDNGINFFDTAIAYQGGTSEQFLGRAIKEYVKREDVIIATKFIPRSPKEIEEKISGQQHIENMLNTSLSNLGTDYVDLYIYHMWDYNTPVIEILEGLDKVVKQGKVRYIGISNCYAWQLARLNDIASERGLTKFISVQSHYNLLFREEEREMFDLCKIDNIAMTPYSSLASGRLSRLPNETSNRLEKDTYAKGKYDGSASEDEKIILRVKELADKHECSMTEISLAWILTKVTSPIVGATKTRHIDGGLKAVDISLSAEEIKYLEELYVPHKLVGVMANAKPSLEIQKAVW